MSDPSSKIITSFQTRLEMENALRSLSEASGDRALRQRAQEIAGLYGDKLLPLLLASLDTPNPQVRAGLGFIAQQLERLGTVSALRGAAHNRSLSDQARLAAITLLERFLDVDAEDAMYAGMAAPQELALRSLRELMADSKSDPLVLAEYIRQLDEEPLDVQLTMLRATRLLDDAEAAPLLGLFAQESNLLIAQEALQALGTIVDVSAGEMLLGLLPNLPSERRQQAERSLQKLRLRGVAVPALQAVPAEARCLASAISSDGFQVLWFLLPQANGAVQGLHLLISEVQGVAAAHGEHFDDPTVLPSPQTNGTLLAGAEDQPLLLEAGCDYGRRRLLAVLPGMWASGNRIAPMYRLLSPQLWRWVAPQPAPPLPEIPAAARTDTAQLLQHPAMASWLWQSPHLYRRAEQILTGSEAPTAESFAAAVQAALQQELEQGDLLPDALHAHLQALVEWFTLAGDARHADLALSAALSVTDAPAEHPLLLAMCELGLRMAIFNLARGLVT